MPQGQAFDELRSRATRGGLLAFALLGVPAVSLNLVAAVAHGGGSAALWTRIGITLALISGAAAALKAPQRYQAIFLIAALAIVGAGALFFHGTTAAGAVALLVACMLVTFQYGQRAGYASVCVALLTSVLMNEARRVGISDQLRTTADGDPHWFYFPLQLACSGLFLVWATDRLSAYFRQSLIPTQRPGLAWRYGAGEISTFDIWGAIDQPILIADRSMKILDCNPAAARLIEHEIGDLVGKDIRDFSDPSQPIQPFPDWVTGGGAYTAPHQRKSTLKTRTGRRVLIESTIHALQDSRGQITHLMILSRDVTTQTLLAREQQLNSLMWQTDALAIVTLDVAGNFIACNPAAEAMLGYASDELAGRHASAFSADPTATPEILANRFRLQVSSSETPKAIKLRHKSGKIVSCFGRVFSIEDPLDPRVAYLGIGINVSDAEGLRIRNKLLDTMWNQVQERVAVINGQGRFTYCNQQFAKAFHRPQAEIVGHPLEDLFQGDEWEAARLAIARARAGEQFSEVVQLRDPLNGTSRWVQRSFSPFVTEGAEAGSVIGIALDITDSRIAELAQRATEAQYEQLLKSVLDAVITTDENGLIVASNPATEKLFGYDRNELHGQSLDILLPKRARSGHRRLMEGYASSNDGGRGMANFREVKGLTKTGKEVSLEIAIAQTGKAGGKHLTAIVRDVTERGNLEKRVRHLDKMRAIGQLAAGIAHDFNNVMAVISGSSELGLERLQDSAQSRRMFERILDSSRLGKDLTAKLLTFARGDAQQLQALDTSFLLADLGEMLSRTFDANVHVDVEFGPDCWHLLADQSQLQNALLNLAFNARDAMANGGNLTIHAHNCPEYLLVDQSGLSRHVDMVQIDITDTGCGMSEEVRQRALEPFFTTKPTGQGTGLGLATAFGVVQRSGGALEIVSEIDRGTTIKVFLPRAVTAARARPAQRDRGSAASRVVLLVEDNAPLRVTLREQLTGAGITVYDAGTAAEARSLFTANTSIEVLVSDYRLAEETTGLQLASDLQGLRPELSVIIMTGYLELSAARDAPSDYVMLTKPVPIDELIGYIRRPLVAFPSVAVH